jgi:hypothetical protein
MFLNGQILIDSNMSNHIPRNILDILQRGRYFYKHGRYGSPKLRFFMLEDGLKTLGWYSVDHGASMATKTGGIPLNIYEK